jgi:hypothetical protein
VVDGDLVPLPGLLLRLLAGPVKPNLDDLADELEVVADAEVAADDLGNSCSSPQLGPPAMGFGALQKQLFELTEYTALRPGVRPG